VIREKEPVKPSVMVLDKSSPKSSSSSPKVTASRPSVVISDEILYISDDNRGGSNNTEKEEDEEDEKRRDRAQSDDLNFHADQKNFLNRQRLISDPRGLSVDKYVKNYHVDVTSRRTKKINEKIAFLKTDPNFSSLSPSSSPFKSLSSSPYARFKGADVSFAALKAALKDVDMEMNAVLKEKEKRLQENEETKGSQVIQQIIRKYAVKKISIWYMIVAPRRKLIQRLTTRRNVIEIVYSIVDQSYNIALIRQRRRKNLLRAGAAIKIQKTYKSFMNRVNEEEQRVEMEERQQIVDLYLTLWYKAVRNGIRIYRYLRFCIRKKIIRKNPPYVDSPQRLRAYYHVSLPKVLDAYIQLLIFHKRFDIKQQLQNNKLLHFEKEPSQRRARAFKEYGAAIIAIQSCVRKYLHRRRYTVMKQNNAMVGRVIIFLSKAMRFRRRNRLQLINNSAIKIQRFMRGIMIRRKIYSIVHAGLKLNFMWRKYIAYKSLKSQLRRVDRPYTIVVHGLRNLPKKYLTSDQIRFKISVWWNPLLHIVSKNDFNTILQSKNPQYIYQSNPFKVIDRHASSIRLVGENGEKDPLKTTTLPSDTNKIISQKSHFGSFFGRLSSNNSFISALSAPSMSSSFVSTVYRGSRIENYYVAPKKSLSLNPFNYGRKHGTKHDNFNHTEPPVVKSNTLHPFTDEKPAEVKPEEESTEKEVSPAKSQENTLQQPHQQQQPLVKSHPPGRKSIVNRGSQNIIPPSSLLRLALTEDEEEDDDDEDDEEDDDEDKEDEKEDEEVGNAKKDKLIPDRPTVSSRGSLAQRSPLSPPTTPARLAGRNSVLNKQSSTASNASYMSNDSCGSDNEKESNPSSSHSPPRLRGHPSNRNRNPSIFKSLASAFSRNNDSNHSNESSERHLPSGKDGDDVEGEGEGNQNHSEVFPKKEETPSESGDSGTKKRSSLFFSNLPSARSTRASVVRTTINFALRLRAMVQKTQTVPLKLDCMCNFEETVVKIPGCHGNSVFKFEILEGERKISHCFFYLGKEGEMMYWGGEYQVEMRTVAPQRRAAHANGNRLTDGDQTKIVRGNSYQADHFVDPVIDFRVIAGAPLRSKCQWARVIVRGKGPLKRTLNNRDFMNSFNIFDTWNRFYLSLDEFGLHLFENKFMSTAFFTIPVSDFRSIRIELGFPIREALIDVQKGINMISRAVGLNRDTATAPVSPTKSRQRTNGGNQDSGDKAILEDIHNVILTTSNGDEVYMR
jgi:hypothetical protein